MDLTPLLRGAGLGFAIAAPVGPIGVLCIRRTLAHGRATGFFTGLGAATADGIYGGIAAFGLAAVATFLASQQVWIRLIGAAFLIWLGLRTLRAQPAKTSASVVSAGRTGAWASTVLLTLSNPTTIFSFAAAFAGLGLAGAHGGYGSAALTTLGVFCGSAFWWLLLSSGVNMLRSRLTAHALRWVNRFSGGVLIVFGLAAALSLLVP
jgi:threonine/homoserine/homoserine lactone efflux protein